MMSLAESYSIYLCELLARKSIDPSIRKEKRPAVDRLGVSVWLPRLDSNQRPSD